MNDIEKLRAMAQFETVKIEDGGALFRRIADRLAEFEAAVDTCDLEDYRQRQRLLGDNKRLKGLIRSLVRSHECPLGAACDCEVIAKARSAVR